MNRYKEPISIYWEQFGCTRTSGTNPQIPECYYPDHVTPQVHWGIALSNTTEANNNKQYKWSRDAK